MPRFAILLLLVLTSAASAAPIKHVVIVSVDGLRPDAITKTTMPRHAKLAAQGASAKQARTIAKSLTLPSHASMISGVDIGVHGLTWNSYRPSQGYIKVPTVFTAARDRKLSTAIFVGKPKLLHLAKPKSVDRFEIPSDPSCFGTSSAAAALFAAKQAPNVMLVHFADPDDAGHADGWESAAYTKALQTADRCLGALIDAIDASDVAASTLVIVTADHGGEGRSHGSGNDLVRRIPWIARGPGFAAGSVIDETVSTFDTAATALAALGLPPLAKSKGTSRLPATR